jgi:hypothetical protein
MASQKVISESASLLISGCSRRGGNGGRVQGRMTKHTDGMVEEKFAVLIETNMVREEPD